MTTNLPRNSRTARALATLVWPLFSACGARSGLNADFAFGGANGAGDVSQGGAMRDDGKGAAAQAGTDGTATAGAGGFGASTAHGGSAGVSPAGAAGDAPHGGGGGGGSGGGGGGGGGRACGLLIDDMEDGTGRICTGGGQIGAWYEYNDGFGVQLPPQVPGSPLLPLPIPASSGRSGRAMYSSHHYPNPGALLPPQAWGAGIGVDLAFDGSTYRTYDAQDVAGIAFWVRSDIFKGYEVRINTTDTTPIKYGGTCPRDYCGRFARSFQFRSEWTQEFVPFSKLVGLSDTGALIDFHPERLTNIQFFFVRYPTDSYDGEIWLDDLRFTPTSPPQP